MCNGALMLLGKIMLSEVPKRTSCQQLLTHFSKSEPSGLAIQFRRKSSRCERACAWGVMRSTVNFVLLEEVFKMSSSALIKGSIPHPLLHQQSGFCPPMQIGLDSKRGPPLLLKTQHGICVQALSVRKAKRARSCFVRSQ